MEGVEAAWPLCIRRVYGNRTVEQTILAPINQTVCVLRTHYGKVSIAVILSNGYIFPNLNRL